MATDAAAGDVVLFGGFAPDSTVIADTWTWNGTTWTQQAPPVSPGGRQWAQMATDPNGRVMLFGGQGIDAQHNQVVLADTWNVSPSLSITPDNGPKGVAVTILGVGFSTAASATAKYTSATTKTVICTAAVAPDTTVTCAGNIPTGPAGGPKGAHDVILKDSSGIKAHTTFTRT
jgi:hypothetical protein